MKCEEDASAAGLAAGCWEPTVMGNFEPRTGAAEGIAQHCQPFCLGHVRILGSGLSSKSAKQRKKTRGN